MEFFEQKYYTVFKNVLKLTGVWPFQELWLRNVLATFIACVYVSILIPQVYILTETFINQFKYLIIIFLLINN